MVDVFVGPEEGRKSNTHLRIIYKQTSFRIISRGVQNIFSHKILGIFFLNLYLKVTCKPMGKFAENFTLGKRFLPLCRTRTRNSASQITFCDCN